MSTELTYLTLTCFITALFWVPYILNRILEHGLIAALHNPEIETPPAAKWAGRMMHAHRNAVENLVIFAPLVLLAEVSQLTSPVTATAAALYFYSKIAHFVIYTFGMPYLRTVAFFVGFIAQMMFAFTLLGIA